MSGDQLQEAEVDRLGAAVFEQRRLAHMLRRRGAEIEALRSERERLAERERKALQREEELRQVLRSRDEKLALLQAEAASRSAVLASSSEDRDRLEEELKQAQYEVRRAERRLEEELKQAQYEVRRAERRVAKTEGDAAEARRRARLQLDSLSAELREGLASRDRALEQARHVSVERDEIREERDQIRGEVDAARASAAASAHEIEAAALELGRERREVELLAALEKEREVLLAGLEQPLEEVAEHLYRVRVSRSWRWGNAVVRALTFRRRSTRSALDTALERLDAGEPERRPA